MGEYLSFQRIAQAERLPLAQTLGAVAKGGHSGSEAGSWLASELAASGLARLP